MSNSKQQDKDTAAMDFCLATHEDKIPSPRSSQDSSLPPRSCYARRMPIFSPSTTLRDNWSAETLVNTGPSVQIVDGSAEIMAEMAAIERRERIEAGLEVEEIGPLKERVLKRMVKTIHKFKEKISQKDWNGGGGWGNGTFIRSCFMS